MTPQERQLVEGLFDRLARLEAAPRDAEAERAVADGLRRAPNAIYPLVQTVLVQDEALKRADARIRELQGDEDEEPAGGFLDSMREVLSGRPSRTSVPTIGRDADRPFAGAAAPGQGSSFLGTAAAAAAGVIGGSLLLNSISSMFGPHGGSAFAAVPPSPPPDRDLGGSDLARQAGIDHVGNSPDDDFDADLGGDFGDL
jgi:hypothetical protein